MRARFSKLVRLAAVLLSVILLSIVASERYVASVAAGYISGEAFSLPRVQAIIVPGAAVYRSGELTPAYRDRVDTAHALYESGSGRKILVSGDGKADGHDEVTPARDRLISLGMPPEDIFLDYEGVSTYYTMRRARTDYGITSAIVVTQPYHLPRSVFLGQWFGIETFGVGTAMWTGTARDRLREALATVKAVAEALMSPSAEVSTDRDGRIEGDGQHSWRDAER